MGFSRSAQIGKERKIQDRAFVSEKAVPYGRIVASDAVESFGASNNLSNLRQANSKATQSRMALPLADTASAGTKSFSANPNVKASNQSSNDFDLYDKLSNRSLQDRGLMGTQDIDLTKRKIREVDTLANNEANRALGMELKTKFPYAKYETETKLMNDSANTLANSSVLSSFNNLVANSFPKQYVSF